MPAAPDGGDGADLSLDHASWSTAAVRARVAAHLAAQADGDGTFTGRLVFARIGDLADVNRRRGRAVGDWSLELAVGRVTDAMEELAGAAHLGGGLLVAVETAEVGADLATAIVALVELPVEIDGLEVGLSCTTFAVALRAAQVATEVEARAVLDRAETRARLAPDLGAPVASAALEFGLHGPAIDALDRALRRGEIVAHYQPIVDLAAGKIVAAEALARWPLAPAGYERPEDFLLLATAAGLHGRLTDQILDQVCRDAARPEAVLARTWFTVNLSVRDAVSASLGDRVIAAVERHGVALERIVFEISERVVPDPVTCRALEHLGELGIRLAIDDFGTGWSSFRQLTGLPIELVKLDRSLVSGELADTTMLTAAASLARALGLQVLAEGIETGEDLLLAQVADVPLGQGYLWGRAVPFEALLQQMRDDDPRRLGVPRRP